MKIGVVGAGAVGGFFAARLAHVGHEVSVLARGKTLEAIRARGIRLESEGQSYSETVRASEHARELGAQDLVLLAVKAPSLPEVAKSVGPLLGAQTVVIPALNGLPWWFFLGDQGPLANHRLNAVDPEGIIERAVPFSRVIGCVVYPSFSAPEPGFARHAAGNRIVIGEPRGGVSQRADTVAGMLQGAGLAAEASDDVRREVWTKLLGNVCFNPVSLLCGCSTDRLIDDGRVYRIFVAMMGETLALGRALDIEVNIRPEVRIAATRKLGNIKTSTLQDAEAGRQVEIDGIIGAVVEAARSIGFPVPLLDAVCAFGRMRAGVLGLL